MYKLLMLATLLLLAAAPASAQHIKGGFQLGLGTSLASYSSGTAEDETGDDAKLSLLAWGNVENATLELGYGVSDMFLLGGLITLGGASRQVTQSEGPAKPKDTQFMLDIGPKAEWMFLRDSSVRPFVSAAAGLSVASQKTGDVEVSTLGVQLQARLGLRWFVAEAFSIDPAFAFSWTTAGGEIETGGKNRSSVDVDLNTFRASLQIAASGWVL
jgi:hypothetical protein